MVPVGLGVVVCFLSSHRQIIPGRSVRVHRGPAWSLRFQRPATFDPRLSRSGATASCNNVDRRMSPCPVAGLRTEGSIELAGDTPAQRERCDRSSARRCRRPTAPPPTISGDALSLGNEHLAPDAEPLARRGYEGARPPLEPSAGMRRAFGEQQGCRIDFAGACFGVGAVLRVAPRRWLLFPCRSISRTVTSSRSCARFVAPTGSSERRGLCGRTAPGDRIIGLGGENRRQAP